MKILTVLGTRPEIIRLSLLIPLLDRHAEHVLVHTGQNFDDRLDALFFRELRLRRPDVYMGVRAPTFSEQIGQILSGIEPLLLQHRPDRLLILGDTNSGLTAIVARRLGIPVFHMEAGNRCYDDRVPEEVNRRVIDHSSSILMPYTQRSRENLLREGIAGEKIFVTGNPIKQVMDAFQPQIDSSTVLSELSVDDKRYILVTMHRAENVDLPERLRMLIDGLTQVRAAFDMPVVCSLHPRTRAKVAQYGIDLERAGVLFVEPLGFFDFVRLERSAFCILTDSGTVQEEACILGTPAVTIRDVTERPETVECGSNVIAGAAPADILACVRQMTSMPTAWTPPPEYVAPLVAETVSRVLLGHHLADRAEENWRRRKQAEMSAAAASSTTG
ncbi:MAG TPA: UDP-N-acetylglucosamine 2-epimerase (non-hydrolyzing) [Polyangiaceae bacterium]